MGHVGHGLLLSDGQRCVQLRPRRMRSNLAVSCSVLDRFCLSVRGMSAPQDTKLRPTPVNSGSDELRVLQGYSREALAAFSRRTSALEEERVVHLARKASAVRSPSKGRAVRMTSTNSNRAPSLALRWCELCELTEPALRYATGADGPAGLFWSMHRWFSTSQMNLGTRPAWDMPDHRDPKSPRLQLAG